MKRWSKFLLLTVFGLAVAMHPISSESLKEDGGIYFQEGTWSEIRQMAKKENKLIFIDIYASWCGPCKALKSRTFPNEKLGDFFNKEFINFAIDAEKGEGVNLASKYKVSGYPTLLFVDGDGDIVAKTSGFHTATELLEVGQKVAGN